MADKTTKYFIWYLDILIETIKDDEDDTETAPEQINKVESAVDITEKFVYEQIKNPRWIVQNYCLSIDKWSWVGEWLLVKELSYSTLGK